MKVKIKLFSRLKKMTSIRETIWNFRTHGPLEYLRVYLSRMMMDPSTDYETTIAIVLIIQEIVTNMTEQYMKSQGSSFEDKLTPLLESRFEDFDFKRCVNTAVYKYSYSDNDNDLIWSDLWKQVVESIVEKQYPHIKQYLKEHYIIDDTVSPQDLAIQAVKCSSDWRNMDDIEEFLEKHVSYGDVVDFCIAFRSDGITLKLDDLMTTLTIEN